MNHYICFSQQLKVPRHQHSIFQSFSTHRRMSTSPEKVVFIDTDAGFDDLLAISSLISHRPDTNSAITVPFISTVGGMQECPHRASRFLDKIYNPLSTTVVVSGLVVQDVLKDEVPRIWLLEYRRKLDEIMLPLEIPSTISIDNTNKEDVTVELHTSLQQTLQQCPDQSVDLLCLGPLTNVASWINDEGTLHLLDCKLKSIYIMGGNTPSHNNESKEDVAEFNFAQDPKAVHTVLTNPILRKRINLVTAQACTKNVVDTKEWNSIVEKSQVDDQQGIISRMFKVEPCRDTYKYDPVSAFALSANSSNNSNLVSMKAIDVTIDQETGLLVAASSKNYDSNNNVSINIVDEVKIGSEYLTFINDAIVNDPEIH